MARFVLHMLIRTDQRNQAYICQDLCYKPTSGTDLSKTSHRSNPNNMKVLEMSWRLNLQSWLEVDGGESLWKKWSEPSSPSLPTPPTYLPCAREKWARRGAMAISNKVVRGGGRNRGAVSARGDKILPPPFSPARGSSRHLHGHSRLCGGWPLLAHGSQRRGWLWGYARFGGIPKACVKGALTCVRPTIWMQPRNPINGLLAPQSLVGLFSSYQSRPRYLVIRDFSISHQSPLFPSISMHYGRVLSLV
jgi:hypothetical protein